MEVKACIGSGTSEIVQKINFYIQLSIGENYSTIKIICKYYQPRQINYIITKKEISNLKKILVSFRFSLSVLLPAFSAFPSSPRALVLLPNTALMTHKGCGGLAWLCVSWE